MKTDQIIQIHSFWYPSIYSIYCSQQSLLALENLGNV